MLDLSPTKLLVIFVVVVLLLGPKRLPEVARQLGAGWRKLREFHGQVDREVRKSIPDLPTNQEIVRFARSPITLLNQLADRPGEAAESSGSTELSGTNGSSPHSSSLDEKGEGGVADSGSTGSSDGNRRAIGTNGDGRLARTVPVVAALDTDDPNLN